VLFGAALTFGIAEVARARSEAAALQALTVKQRQQLQKIARKAAAIGAQLRGIQRQDIQIQRLIGVKPAVQKTARLAAPLPLGGLSDAARHVDLLAAQSSQTAAESGELKRLTMHVLNLRHIQALSQARLLAAIPSIDPVPGAPVVGCYCYRTSPDVEFHPGVDLGADYGATVLAAAAGTVAAAGWDGGYGMKIDIDHGNGYHTWYAHLSQMDVQPGEYVHKGQPIGLVGSTGFSTGPHLHYQIMLDGSPVDPDPYLTGVPSQVLASLK
jgi:murein DD-endopeptidase MepM/ murein hydrolase activator NlpD